MTEPTDFQDRGDAARRAAGIDGTAGDAQDVPHVFVLDKPTGGCLLCGLAESYRKHEQAPATDEAVVEQVARHLDDWERQSSRTRVPRAELARELVAIVQASHAPATDQAALRDRIAEALLTTRRTDYEGKADHRQHRYDARCALCAYDVDALADAVLAVLPAPADRATVLREEAALIRAHCPDHLDSNSAEGSWINCHCDVADDMERRMAAEAAPATTPRPVQHAPGKAILCPDCRDKGHSACMADGQPAAAQQPEGARP